jgi:hypothetical protein
VDTRRRAHRAEKSEETQMKKDLLTLILAAGCLLLPANGFGGEHAPQARRTYAQELRRPAPAGNQILYHNGLVLVKDPAVFVVYYGSFPQGPTGDIATVNNFFTNIGTSPAFNVNSTYYDKNNNHVQNKLKFNPVKTTYQDAYSLGNKLNNGDTAKVVANAIAVNGWVPTSNAVYFVVTSPDVGGSEVNLACGWHDWTTTLITPGKLIMFSLDPEIKGCNGNLVIFHEHNSPNNNLALDASLDTMMHELSEAATDPSGKGWYTGNGNENGDLCNFNYGTTYLAPNGTHANLHLGSFDYLVQTIWENSGSGFCANTLP